MGTHVHNTRTKTNKMLANTSKMTKPNLVRCNRQTSRAIRVTTKAVKRNDVTKGSRNASQVVERAALGSAVSAAAIALAPAAHAAQEFAQVAEGEPLLVSIGWGSLLATFSFSLALVVWGRSGL